MPEPSNVRRIRKDPSDFDAFAFDTPDYNVDNFYVGATDGNGTTSPAIHVPISPSLYMEIEKWMADHRVPAYRNKADFLRDALRHRLEYLNKRIKDPEMARALRLYTMQSELESIRSKSDDHDRRVKKAGEDCALYVGRGDWRSLDLAIDHLLDFIDDTPEPYRGRALDLVKQYKPYLEGKSW